MRYRNLILSAPIVGFVSLFTFTYLSLLPLFYKLTILCMVYVFTILLPRLCIYVYRKLNGWAPVQLRLRENRAIPYILFILSYVACLHLMFRMHMPRYMCGILVSALFMFNPVWWLCVTVLISGAVGTARMLLRQHSLAQVVAGTLVGVVCGFAGIILL